VPPLLPAQPCSDIGGCKEQIEKMREVVELPMLQPEKFVQLGIDPPKGVLCYGPPGGRSRWAGVLLAGRCKCGLAGSVTARFTLHVW
jgi:ATP-dependent 26S proteasome regulatory subunit